MMPPQILQKEYGWIFEEPYIEGECCSICNRKIELNEKAHHIGEIILCSTCYA